ncbi:MAG TPA: SprT family zinc-dependent metalloprotease [Candidatus Saccharimonadales bacterium]|nr:SprT family zinc-dependent metalloprotease [Candidatus Saccharimonadales bacterium]
MPAKSYQLEVIGAVHIYKRRGTKHMRLSIASDGKVKMTIPAWATYTAALEFAESRRQWIQDNLPVCHVPLGQGQHIGKAHRLFFETADVPVPRSRIAGSEIRVSRPAAMLITHPEVQAAASKAGIRALRLQAAKLLPGRLRQLAAQYGFTYTSVQVKQLKGRWGSCDSQQRITLNLFLMQLPWHLIDYVLLHELVHTKHMNHGPGFWQEFLRHEPRAKLYRAQIKSQQPTLKAIEAETAMA